MSDVDFASTGNFKTVLGIARAAVTALEDIGDRIGGALEPLDRIADNIGSAVDTLDRIAAALEALVRMEEEK